MVVWKASKMLRDSITNRLLIHGRLRCGRTKDGVKIKVFVVAGGTIAGCCVWL
jgi:hypothetical protein